MFDNYLIAKSQLEKQNNANINIDGNAIFIETSPQRWRLSTKILNNEILPSKNVNQIFSSTGLLRWKDKDAYLHLDPSGNCVFLVQEFESHFQYLPFKQSMGDFLGLAEEWKEIFEGFLIE